MVKELLKDLDQRIKGNEKVVDRWSEGIPHHPLSELIVGAMSHIDWKCYDLAVDIRHGGDGDNGEMMMYILDEYFERFGGVEDIKKMLP